MVMKMADGYKAKKFSAKKASGLVVKELWHSCIKYMERKAGYREDDALALALSLDESIAQKLIGSPLGFELRFELDPIRLYMAENMTLKVTAIHRELTKLGHQINYKKVQRLKREVDEIYEQAELDMYELSLIFKSELYEILKLHNDEKLGKPIPISEEKLSESDEREISHLVRETTRVAETEEI